MGEQGVETCSQTTGIQQFGPCVQGGCPPFLCSPKVKPHGDGAASFPAGWHEHGVWCPAPGGEAAQLQRAVRVKASFLLFLPFFW